LGGRKVWTGLQTHVHASEIPWEGPKGRWIEVVRDDWEVYDELWKDGTEENKRKRTQIEVFKVKWWTDEFSQIPEEAPMIQDVERRSVWEQ